MTALNSSISKCVKSVIAAVLAIQSMNIERALGSDTRQDLQPLRILTLLSTPEAILLFLQISLPQEDIDFLRHEMQESGVSMKKTIPWRLAGDTLTAKPYGRFEMVEGGIKVNSTVLKYDRSVSARENFRRFRSLLSQKPGDFARSLIFERSHAFELPNAGGATIIIGAILGLAVGSLFAPGAGVFPFIGSIIYYLVSEYHNKVANKRDLISFIENVDCKTLSSVGAGREGRDPERDRVALNGVCPNGELDKSSRAKVLAMLKESANDGGKDKKNAPARGSITAL